MLLSHKQNIFRFWILEDVTFGFRKLNKNCKVTNKSKHEVHILHISLIFLFDSADVDEPPRSDAGQDVVIQLPTDWAVLDGRDSVDDQGINHYDWTLVRGDTAINMKVSVYLI